MARKENREQTGRFTRVLMCLLLCLALVGCGRESVVSSAGNSSNVSNEASTEETISTELAYEFVDVSCITLKVPVELSEYLVHEQSTYGTSVTEAFYMKTDEEDIPIYRIDVGDETLGDWLGMLKTANGDVPITYTVFVVTEEQLAALGEGAADIYTKLMNAFNVMLEDVLNDARFTTEKPLAIGEDKEVQMTYWTVMLPSNMSYTETMDNGNYHAIFSGEIQGEKVDLYSVRIGDILAETEIGLFIVDGVAKSVSVESYDIAERVNWTEDDYSAAYRMMDTINHVIETIMGSPDFFIPEIVEEPMETPAA